MRLVVDAHGTKIPSERDHDAGETLVGDEQVRPSADNRPRNALGLAHVDQTRERADRGDPHVETRRSSKAIRGMPRHRLVSVNVAVKAIVDEKSLKRRCMSCCHRSRLRLPNRQLIEHMRPDRRDVARPHGNDEVAGFSERGHGRGNVNPARNVMRLGVAGMI